MKFKHTLKTTGLIFTLAVLLFSGFFSIFASNQVSAAKLTAKQQQAAAKKACKGTSNTSLCVDAWVNGYNGQSAQSFCLAQTGGGPDESNCETWLNLGRAAAGSAASAPVTSTTTTPPAASTAAQANCGDSTASSYVPCVTGFDNPNDSTACDKYSGADNTTCTTAQAAGKQAAAAASPADNSQLSCDTTFSNPLTWVICPVVNILVGVINGVDGLITDQLNIKTNTIFCNSHASSTDPCNAYKQAWSQFRNIALGLMALGGLVMVISQALGMELLDAYTIRKILPRILVAAICITLSWQLMKFFVQLTDDVGFGIRALIFDPFSKLGNNINLSIMNGGVGGFFGGLGVGGAAAVVAVPVWIVAGGAGVLLSYAATAGLAVLIAFLVLVLRQIAIILLIIIAPIAIVAYILPNTHQFYKLWWESFSKAMLMFPIIAAFIAVGRVFAAVSFAQGGPINGFIGFAAYFAPYFLIPATFKLAGGALRQIGDFANNRGRGGFDRLRQYRGNTAKNRTERARGQGLYRGANKFTRGLNKIGMYSVDLDEQIPYDLGTGKRLGRLTGPVGKRLFGRQAAEMAGKKGNMFGQQTAKGVEEADMHYSTAWAALGMRNRLIKDGGVSGEGLQAMDQKYGLDSQGERTNVRQNEAGEWVSKNDEAAKTWKPPRNGDSRGLLALGADLRQYGAGGSMAQYAGGQLREGRVGILSSFGDKMETQRATLQSVALTTAARDGKLDAEEAIPMLETMASSPDIAAKQFAEVQLNQIERANQANRQDQRAGKGIKRDESGKLFYVHSDKQVHVRERDNAGQLIDHTTAAYKTRVAYDSANSMKGQAALGAKAESIRNMAPSIISMATSERPEILKSGEAQAMRDAVIAGSLNTYADADSIMAWKEILAQIPQASPEETARANEQVRRQQEAASGRGGGGPGAGGNVILPGGQPPASPPTILMPPGVR